jgi:hypothetical protein
VRDERKVFGDCLVTDVFDMGDKMMMISRVDVMRCQVEPLTTLVFVNIGYLLRL